MISQLKSFLIRFWRLEVALAVLLISLVFGIFVPEFMMEGQLCYVQRHESIVQSINNQIDLFKANHGHSPQAMRTESWHVKGSPLSSKYYFPKGVPSHCPNGQEWQINPDTGYLIPHQH